MLQAQPRRTKFRSLTFSCLVLARGGKRCQTDGESIELKAFKQNFTSYVKLFLLSLADLFNACMLSTFSSFHSKDSSIYNAASPASRSLLLLNWKVFQGNLVLRQPHFSGVNKMGCRPKQKGEKALFSCLFLKLLPPFITSPCLLLQDPAPHVRKTPAQIGEFVCSSGRASPVTAAWPHMLDLYATTVSSHNLKYKKWFMVLPARMYHRSTIYFENSLNRANDLILTQTDFYLDIWL